MSKIELLLITPTFLTLFDYLTRRKRFSLIAIQVVTDEENISLLKYYLRNHSNNFPMIKILKHFFIIKTRFLLIIFCNLDISIDEIKLNIYF